MHVCPFSALPTVGHLMVTLTAKLSREIPQRTWQLQNVNRNVTQPARRSVSDTQHRHATALPPTQNCRPLQCALAATKCHHNEARDDTHFVHAGDTSAVYGCSSRGVASKWVPESTQEMTSHKYTHNGHAKQSKDQKPAATCPLYTTPRHRRLVVQSHPCTRNVRACTKPGACTTHRPITTQPALAQLQADLPSTSYAPRLLSSCQSALLMAPSQLSLMPIPLY